MKKTGAFIIKEIQNNGRIFQNKIEKSYFGAIWRGFFNLRQIRIFLKYLF